MNFIFSDVVELDGSLGSIHKRPQVLYKLIYMTEAVFENVSIKYKMGDKRKRIQGFSEYIGTNWNFIYPCERV